MAEEGSLESIAKSLTKLQIQPSIDACRYYNVDDIAFCWDNWEASAALNAPISDAVAKSFHLPKKESVYVELPISEFVPQQTIAHMIKIMTDATKTCKATIFKIGIYSTTKGRVGITLSWAMYQ